MAIDQTEMDMGEQTQGAFLEMPMQVLKVLDTPGENCARRATKAWEKLDDLGRGSEVVALVSIDEVQKEKSSPIEGHAALLLADGRILVPGYGTTSTHIAEARVVAGVLNYVWIAPNSEIITHDRGQVISSSLEDAQEQLKTAAFFQDSCNLLLSNIAEAETEDQREQRVTKLQSVEQQNKKLKERRVQIYAQCRSPELSNTQKMELLQLLRSLEVSVMLDSIAMGVDPKLCVAEDSFLIGVDIRWVHSLVDRPNFNIEKYWKLFYETIGGFLDREAESEKVERDFINRLGAKTPIKPHVSILEEAKTVESCFEVVSIVLSVLRTRDAYSAHIQHLSAISSADVTVPDEHSDWGDFNHIVAIFQKMNPALTRPFHVVSDSTSTSQLSNSLDQLLEKHRGLIGLNFLANLTDQRVIAKLIPEGLPVEAPYYQRELVEALVDLARLRQQLQQTLEENQRLKKLLGDAEVALRQGSDNDAAHRAAAKELQELRDQHPELVERVEKLREHIDVLNQTIQAMEQWRDSVMGPSDPHAPGEPYSLSDSVFIHPELLTKPYRGTLHRVLLRFARESRSQGEGKWSSSHLDTSEQLPVSLVEDMLCQHPNLVARLIEIGKDEITDLRMTNAQLLHLRGQEPLYDQAVREKMEADAALQQQAALVDELQQKNAELEAQLVRLRQDLEQAQAAATVKAAHVKPGSGAVSAKTYGMADPNAEVQPLAEDISTLSLEQYRTKAEREKFLNEFFDPINGYFIKKAKQREPNLEPTSYTDLRQLFSAWFSGDNAISVTVFDGLIENFYFGNTGLFKQLFSESESSTAAEYFLRTVSWKNDKNELKRLLPTHFSNPTSQLSIMIQQWMVQDIQQKPHEMQRVIDLLKVHQIFSDTDIAKTLLPYLQYIRRHLLYPVTQKALDSLREFPLYSTL